MKGRPDCPRCQGQGLVFDPDPVKPVIVCGCTADLAPDAETLGLPARYREADFTHFWKWWNNVQASTARTLLNRVGELEDLLARPPEEVGELEGRDDLTKLLAALRQQSVAGGGWLPGGGAGQRLGGNTGLQRGLHVECARIVANLGGFINHLGEPVRVKVHICKRGEDGFNGEGVNLRVGGAQQPGAVRVLADALDRVDQQVLKRGRVFVLAADADYLASLALRGLFTLVTKHDGSPSGVELLE